MGPFIVHPAQLVNIVLDAKVMRGTETRIPSVAPLRTPRIFSPRMAANASVIVPATRKTNLEKESQMVGTLIVAKVVMKMN